MNDSGNEKSNVSQPEFSPLDLWDRYHSGEDLSEKQIEFLSNSLKNDVEFRRTALAERTVDQMLRIEVETPDQTEGFLGRVLAKCTSATEDNLPVATALQGLDTRLLDRTLLENINKDRINIRKKEGRLFQTKNAWLAMAAVVLVSITGIGFWYQNQNVGNQRNQSLDLSKATKKIETIEESAALDGTAIASGGRVDDLVTSNPKASDEEALEHSDDPTGHNQTAGLAKNPQVLATVTKVERLSENTKLVSGLSLGKESIIISEGELEIAMSSGVQIKLFAPCRLELQAENSIRLVTGELSLEVPNQLTKFQLETPAIAVANTDSAFDIVVEESGRTEVEVRRGGIAVQAIDYPNAQAWDLNADATNSLVVYTSPDSLSDGLPLDNASGTSSRIHGPIASFAKGLSGDKIGVITYNGQSRSFDDEVVFSKVREHVFQGVRSPGESFAKNWSRFVETAANEPQPVGTIQLNGKEYSFDNYNEAVLAQNNVLAQFAPSDKTHNSNDQNDGQISPPAANSDAPSSFRGTLFIRGQHREFQNFDEYQTALRELMGPAAEFGFFSFKK
ncbi:MAG: hypothetical protein ACK5PB_17635 [Pirellula sp.]|jgi:hypothetical protein